MSQKKTVWIINHYASTPQTGFAGRHYYLGQELAKLGYNVYIIAASYTHILRQPLTFEDDFYIENHAPNFNYVWVKVPEYAESRSKRRVLNWFEFSWKILKLPKILSEKPDIILNSSLSLVSYMAAEKLAKKLKVPLYFEVRDIWPLTLLELGGYSKSHPFIMLLQWIEDRAYKNSYKVISNLKNSVEHMVSRGLERSKFHWIPNGFSQDEVSNKEPLDPKISALLPQNKFIVGYTGTLGLANCLHYLLQAAKEFKSNEDVAFVIVGKGDYKAELQAYAQEHNLKNVTFIDPIPKIQIQSMLDQFDVCYIGLTQDPLFKYGVSPNKLFDYLYSGKPLLYGIDSGNYKPVSEANAGYEFIPENVPDLIKKIQLLVQMPASERLAMGYNGRILAESKYEYSKLAQELERVLEL
ncbi:glycosyltransferase family 4 protein [Acinetobacter sp. R933-2]|uniref:glycosyltransferase family 4 protein n=1 Tax=Acinetobacter sp. R933-2 TaxID=2746728 RepID=UPI00257665A3|nr:glycosyltransferase family 4 protein [Acinetobacter sp. R933-2]MDM1248677.1 glycosyltransferase family 4 protein [Acinetobacter sp. R933-2]